jgi:hypothetical protein
MEQLGEVAAVDPQVLQGDEVGGVVRQAGGEEGAVDTTGTRAHDDVDLHLHLELAAQVDPLLLGIGMTRPRADRAEELVGDAADPDRQAHAPVEREPEPDLAKHESLPRRRRPLRRREVRSTISACAGPGSPMLRIVPATDVRLETVLDHMRL